MTTADQSAIRAYRRDLKEALVQALNDVEREIGVQEAENNFGFTERPDMTLRDGAGIYFDQIEDAWVLEDVGEVRL